MQSQKPSGRPPDRPRPLPMTFHFSEVIHSLHSGPPTPRANGRPLILGPHLPKEKNWLTDKPIVLQDICFVSSFHHKDTKILCNWEKSIADHYQRHVPSFES